MTLRVAEAKGLIKIEHWVEEDGWKGRLRLRGDSLPLVPDAVFLVSDNRSDREATIFLETDNSTEPLRRTTMLQSSFFRKCAAYWQYWTDEIRPRHETMIVLTVAKTAERAEALRLSARAVDEEDRGLNLFLFADEHAWDVLAPEHFLYEPVWTTAGDEQRTLFEQRQS